MLIESILTVIIINAIGLIWGYTQQSDKATDLFYSLSFAALTGVLWFAEADSLMHHLLFGMILLWSFRLGSYLFKRIHAIGKDDRFDQMRKQFIRFASFWLLQALSVLILSIPILIIFQKSNIEFVPMHLLGIGLWAFGLSIETIADQQKFAFRQNSTNDGQFIQTGLWKRVQHPNYLGEILCWIGIFVCAIPSLENWEWLAIISPIWITFLLVFVSGIPLLQKASKKKYGSLKSYQIYQKNTPLLIPFLY
ncbi:MAG: steroid 5-alpha reductase family enzyme [Aureispira sp.]|jgi:steroid 5-alpha reductase family enzyme